MDPYETLGIARSATDDEVKKAYRELSRKYHPDANANNPLKELAEEKFKEVQAAYSRIMDEREHGGVYGQGDAQNPFGGYQSGGYQTGSYQRGYQNGGQQGYNPYQRQQYQSYGNRYGRDPYGGNTCGTGNLCCDLWCADTLCECMGGDLCTCF